MPCLHAVTPPLLTIHARHRNRYPQPPGGASSRPWTPWSRDTASLPHHVHVASGGRPCVRGFRIRVTDVLDLLASGLSPEQVLEELPDLEVKDISACLRFASRRLDQPIVAA
ncbi:MAG: DUF433 domain-containing protein [Acidobacteria bacterium]|nr:DUF433 domain-containing protein [Acidobacteriota bacterium]